MLDEIVAKQRFALPDLMKAKPLAGFENKIIKKDFAFAKALQAKEWSLIAECKLASPVKGRLCEVKTVPELAALYSSNGATALSVHTNEYFLGQLNDLAQVKKQVQLPVMRKEFIVHPYQVYETAYQGADALLLIARILNGQELKELYTEARGMGLDCLVEVHDEKDLEKTFQAGCEIIGINNRDLKSFQTDIKNTLKLKPLCGDRLVISESGIKSQEDIKSLQAVGVRGILVGEALVVNDDIAKKTREMALLEEETR